MSLYINELAPWERKNEYYHNIQLGKDVNTQTEVISRSSKAMIATQMASTNAIIASQDRIREGIDNLGYGTEKVEQGIYGLQAAFEWGISEVVWQIEQNRQELRNILEVLSAPLDTQAKELRKRAEEAYANGWFEDALEDFFESEKKNRYDFSIHISIGMIYLFHKTNKEKALEYFDKAIKYATPKSKYHTSLALLHKALIKRDFGLIEEAEACSGEAVELSPDFSEAIYQCAQYNALLNKPDKSILLLTKAINIDANYAVKVCNDESFDQLRPQINKILEEFRKIEGDKARNQYAITTKRVEKFDKLVNEVRDTVNIQTGELRKCMARVNELMKRNSFRDFLEANTVIEKLRSTFDNLRGDAIGQLEKSIQSQAAGMNKFINDEHQQIKKIGDKMGMIIPIGALISLIFGLKECSKMGGHNALDHGSGTDNPLGALWALIWITVVGIVITVGLYMVITSVLESNAKNETSSRINERESVLARINGYVNNLKEL
jgi:tetratricopeptide (TPR) repeat protein